MNPKMYVMWGLHKHAYTGILQIKDWEKRRNEVTPTLFNLSTLCMWFLCQISNSSTVCCLLQNETCLCKGQGYL